MDAVAHFGDHLRKALFFLVKRDLNVIGSESLKCLNDERKGIKLIGDVGGEFRKDAIVDSEMVIIIIIFSDFGGREGFFGSFKPFLIKVKFTSITNMSPKIMFLSGVLKNFQIFLHFILAQNAADNI